MGPNSGGPGPGSASAAATQQAADLAKYFPDTGVSEPSVMSTDAAKGTLNTAVTAHNADVTAITPKPPAPAAGGSTTDPATDAAMKQAGGVTAQEAQAAGIDLSKYTYDPDTRAYFPTNGTVGQQNQYQTDLNTVNSAFQNQGNLLGAATSATIASLQAIYGQRIAMQTQINQAQQASTNTQNIRGGASRYAPGVAGSILTAEEQSGLQKISDIQNELTSKINDANTALQNKQYQTFLDQRTAVDKLKSDYQTTLNGLKKSAQDEYDKLQTNIKATQTQIQTIATDAAKNGAPASTISAILAAKTINDAISAAGNSLETSTNADVSGYLFYKNQAISSGQTPESFDAWKSAQDTEAENKAYGTAFATAKGKAAGEAATKGQTTTSPVTASTGSAKGIVFSAPASIAPYVGFSANGVKYVDLSNFAGTPTEKNQAVQDAQASGYRVITNKNTALDVQNITDATAKLTDIKTAFDANNTGDAAQRDSYAAAFMWAGKELQTNPAAVGTDVYQDAALDILKAMSGVQGFRGGAAAVDQVKATFPQTGDTQAVVDAKIANLQKMIDDRQTALVGEPSATDQLLINGANAQDTLTNFVTDTPTVTINGTATSTANVISAALRLPGATPASVLQAMKDRGLIPNN